MPLTQFERWTDYGEEILLRVIVGDKNTLNSGMYCRLFQLPSTDPEDDTLFDIDPTDFSEADFTGYSAITFGFSIPMDPLGDGNWETLSNTLCVFNRRNLVEPVPGPLDTGTSNTIYGYYLTCSNAGVDSTRPLYYRFFNDGAGSLTPKDMNVPNVDQITVVPRTGLIGLEDVNCGSG